MDAPEMLGMLIAKLPGGLIDRWNRNVQVIREGHLREPDLQDLIKFVEEETVLINDPLFSRETLHEYTNYPERSTHVKARKLKNYYTKADQKAVEQTVTVASIKCKFCDGNHDLDDCQFYREITVDDRSSFLKKNRLCYGCYAEISSKHTARSCTNRRVCEVCQGRHPTGLHGYKTKNKKSPNEAKADNKNETAMKSNCAGIGNAATNLGEVISMCVVSVRLRHCNSDKEVSTFALLDTCSQGTFVADDLLKKLALSGVRTSTVKVKLSLIEGRMVSKQPLSKDKRIQWVKLPKLYSREHMPVDSAEIATPEKLKKWRYLDSIAKDIATDDKVSVDLLIGANCIQALEPISVISSQDGGPYALQTILGWCIVGPIECTSGKVDTVSCNHTAVSEAATNKIQSHPFQV